MSSFTMPTVVPEQRGPEELTDRQRQVLDFEREWWLYAGAKAAAVRARFGLELRDYEQAMTQLVTLPAARYYDRATVHRLLRRCRLLASERENSAFRAEKCRGAATP